MEIRWGPQKNKMATQTMSIGFTSGTRTTNDSKALVIETEMPNINRLPIISMRTT